MQTVAIKSLVLAVLVLLSCWGVYLLHPFAETNSNEYLAAIIDKHHRLDSLPSPKLVFVGASNLAFGLDCRMIEDTFHIPVVNMGLHGGLGLSFILKEGITNIRQGDIVVLSVEYYVGLKGDPQLIEHAAKLYPPAISYAPAGPLESMLPLELRPDFLMRYLERVRETVIHGIPGTPGAPPRWGYRRQLFSPYGDVVGELNMPKPAELKDANIGKHDYTEGITLLNEFAASVRSRGASVYFVYPDYADSYFRKNTAAIDHLRAQYAKSLAIPIINTPADFVLNDSLFIDTVYHLTKAGREERTRRMISILRRTVFRSGDRPAAG